MRKFTRKRYIGALAVIAVLAMAGAAVAFFTSTGNGTGSATVGSAGPWTVGESGTPTGGPLYPDAAIGTGHIQTDGYTVTNAGSGSQNLNKVVISVANSDGSAWSSSTNNPSKPACTANDFSVGGAATGTAWTDNSLAGDYVAGAFKSGTVTVQMIDNSKNQDNCQGVTVPLYMSAS